MQTIAQDGVVVPAPDVLKRFDLVGPRYTSYPTADRFVDAFDAAVYRSWLARRDSSGDRALSLYVHLPFCNTVCYYCACNKVITKDRGRAAEYLRALEAEVDLVSERLAGSRDVEQLHFGGGTPTFLDAGELRQVMAMLGRRFALGEPGSGDREFSIEVDPRTCAPDKVRVLADIGFNRMSVGVQDFDPAVQKAVNRQQGFETTRATLEAARAAGFGSINLDLIYGLPKQSRATFAGTLDRVLELDPDRIALYQYAHLPERFKPQRRILPADLPPAQERLGIMVDAIARLTASGYRYIGMDHFAKGDDDLARAQEQGRLHRNFQGYSTRPDCDLVGLGVSAISKVGPTYAQNVRELDEYYERLRGGTLPTARGVLLDDDDQTRRAVIMALMCHFEVSKAAIERAHGIDFDAYFRRELGGLDDLAEAGLVQADDETIVVTPQGKLLVRAIAMRFDRYLMLDGHRRGYSRVA